MILTNIEKYDNIESIGGTRVMIIIIVLIAFAAVALIELIALVVLKSRWTQKFQPYPWVKWQTVHASNALWSLLLPLVAAWIIADTVESLNSGALLQEKAILAANLAITVGLLGLIAVIGCLGAWFFEKLAEYQNPAIPLPPEKWREKIPL